ncbi:J domain-containing protein [Anaerocolumna sedimenticola]|uniref:J domain-containing protein n=1 Tax=Anaerocolumna sedimenticola TaxID=2696063 RepID=A0A6P1TQU9_9FIRM|nr:J domain-containing protein [Anaerocolumna sedimenticola]QHQ62136.1 J domain-containing protein [Anaerocolumna sedimenticola]
MSDCYISYGDIKRKIRNLKKVELKIRFHVMDFSESNNKYTLSKMNNTNLIWDDFFDLHESTSKSVKYPLKRLAKMNKDELKNIISEFYYGVYYQFYKDNGMLDMSFYDPDILAQLGLPFDADICAIKKRFRELAKIYHPDVGGDGTKFIELLEQFESLHIK